MRLHEMKQCIWGGYQKESVAVYIDGLTGSFLAECERLKIKLAAAEQLAVEYSRENENLLRRIRALEQAEQERG